MNKFRIIFINLFLIILGLVLADFHAFSTNPIYRVMTEKQENPIIAYISWFPHSHNFSIFYNKKTIDKLFILNKYTQYEEEPKWNLFRPIENEDANQSILIFGCSFTYGFLFENNETISYKLGELFPQYSFYNRALTGATTNHMLYQLENYDFKEAKNVKTVIYVFIPDHIMRNYNSSITMETPYYKSTGKEDVKLQNISFKYIFAPIVITLKQKYTNYLYSQLENCKEKNNIMHKRVLLTKQIIEKSHKLITKKFGENTNFIILRYDMGEYTPYNWIFEELKEKNIKSVSLTDLSNTNFYSEEYQLADKCHPNQKAWNEIIPLFYNYITQKKLID